MRMPFMCRAVLSIPEISAASTPPWGTHCYGRGARRAELSGPCLKMWGRCRANPDRGMDEGRKRTGRMGVGMLRVRRVIGKSRVLNGREEIIDLSQLR